MAKVLLLNASWEPLNFIDEWHAIKLSLRGRVEILYEWDNRSYNSPSRVITLPATVRLISMVKKRWTSPKYRRKILFIRDNWACQYCGTELTNNSAQVDHIFPYSRGGKTDWFNCVAACFKCNNKKGAKTPEEANMTLCKKPTAPTPYHFIEPPLVNGWHHSWNDFVKYMK